MAEDPATLRELLQYLDKRFLDLALFQFDRKHVIAASARYATQVCAGIVALNDTQGWLDPSSAGLMDVARALENLTKGLQGTFVALSSSKSSTDIPPWPAVVEGYETAIRFEVVTRALRYVLRRQAWSGVTIDSDSRIVDLAAPSEESSVREWLNSASLHRAEEANLRASLRQSTQQREARRTLRALRARLAVSGGLFPLSNAPSQVVSHLRTLAREKQGVHTLEGIVRLNNAHAVEEFCRTSEAIRMTAEAVILASDNLCAVWEIERDAYERELAAISGLAPPIVSAVVSDLTFRFGARARNRVGYQYLLEAEPGRLLVIPLLIVERTLDSTTYIHVSKGEHAKDYNRYQETLTRMFEGRVREALQRLVAGGDPRPLKLPGRGGGVAGQIDCVVADVADGLLLLVQVKYLLDANNDTIAAALRQLERDERLLRTRWPEVRRSVGMPDSPVPAGFVKLVVTNWFRGTEPRPQDVSVVTIEELENMSSRASLTEFAKSLATFGVLPPQSSHEREISLFDYTFRYRTAQ